MVYSGFKTGAFETEWKYEEYRDGYRIVSNTQSIFDDTAENEGSFSAYEVTLTENAAKAIDDIKKELASRHVIDHKVKQETMK